MLGGVFFAKILKVFKVFKKGAIFRITTKTKIIPVFKLFLGRF